MAETYTPTIGLEVHVQLRTRTKMFCACALDFGAPPNTRVCPVCLGYPGVLPVMNEEAIRLTVLAGLMIGSTISAYSKFDRKNYFYPDMPKNYQISQYDKPLCEGGTVEIEVNGELKRVGITRIHLEEDVAKNMHFAHASGIDFNRAGYPLMEVVSEPELASPDEAAAFLRALKQMLEYAAISDCNLEQGNMRCDVNCSVRPAGRTTLGAKVEIKNLNTIKGVHAALQYEIARQTAALAAGETLTQETRLWDSDAGVTTSMRTKESAHDYRYFPEPDLMPVVLDAARVEAWRAQLPELPRQRRERFVRDYGIPQYDARVLAADRAVADYYEAAARQSDNPKGVSNWMMSEMLRLLAERDTNIRQIAMKPDALAELVRLVDEKTINVPTAKDVFATLFAQGGSPHQMVKERGLAQVSDVAALEQTVQTAIRENPKSVEDYRKGKKAALQFLVGQVMRLTRGKANPQVARELLTKKLDE
ncbi:MAG: Asp-tRNA(Asn)/Glu-tRNA(Gln) amidotransferase subunit GatB [Kiritimatiellae bacterium]|nr:Asp-tRNA(Asn)/Glu-tRNA(Gln) amidotransferase subunit GatB [Kiritimatiellia bacterium]